MSLLQVRGQMFFFFKALRVDLGDIPLAGGPGREPAIIGHDLQPADRGAVTWGGGQFGCDRPASESISGNAFRRQFLKPRLLIRGRWRIDARVVWRTELGC